jgi:hypothetical protein
MIESREDVRAVLARVMRTSRHDELTALAVLADRLAAMQVEKQDDQATVLHLGRAIQFVNEEIAEAMTRAIHTPVRRSSRRR